MIELEDDELLFHFPHLDEEAICRIGFQRTLRVPDTGQTYPLPAGLGPFPLRHVDDYAERLPDFVVRRGGVIMPMWQAEALWISTDSWFPTGDMPFAVKIAAGKINVVSGEPWREGLHREPQDYLAVPKQPWLDGFKTDRDTVRQFVATPLGAGLTAEEQLTGAAEHGGIQISVTPLTEAACALWRIEGLYRYRAACKRVPVAEPMGLAPGGRISQRIYADDRPLEDYDTARSLRVFVTILDALSWWHVTGELPPTRPPTARDYAEAGLPWFDLYDRDVEAVGGAAALAGLRSIGEAGALGGDDEDVDAGEPIILSLPSEGATPGRPVRAWTGG